VRANRVYELLAARDHVEVVEVASGEVVLFWDTPPALTGRFARALRTDLAQLEAEAFLEKWRRYDGAGGPA
jgi:hypothetical protein